MKFDVVVIGSGIGGLSAAATLAKNGYRVHLIESHDKVGGFATNYRRGKYRMESGIHMMAGAHADSLYRPIFDYFGLEQNVSLVEIPEFYDCYFNQNIFKMPFKISEASKKLIETFPHEKVAIEKFFSDMYEIADHFQKMLFRKPYISAVHPFFTAVYAKYEKYWQMSIGHYLDLIVKDPHLKISLLANMTFYHDQPYELSLVQYMICQINYFEGGGYFIQGGSQNFSDYLKKIILDHGGTVTLNHKVIQLRYSNDMITEVFFQKTKGDHKEIKNCQADFVVFNGARPNVFNELLHKSSVVEPAKDFTKELQRQNKLGLSTSSCTIYYGLKKPLQDLGCKAYMNLVIDAKLHSQDRHPYKGSFGVINYDQIETKLCPPTSYSCEVITMDKMSNWSNYSHDPEQYLLQKDQLKNDIAFKMNRIFPGFSDQIVFSDVSSPHTVQRYTHAPEGAIYGYSPSPESFRLRSPWYQWDKGAKDNTFSNLFFASAWSFLPGFTGAMIGGYKAAQELMQSSRR